MKYKWLLGIAALGFFLLGYISLIDGEMGAAGITLVLGIAFIALGTDVLQK